VQPAELASYDAWIKYYRPDDNSANASISYYTKGLVIGFLLDAKIRRMTGGSKTLDDLMRLMYQRFSGARGYTPENLRATAAEIVGEAHAPELRRWFNEALETTNELGYSEAVEWYGLQFVPEPDVPKAFLGVATRGENSRTIVSEVRRGSPAEEAGIMRGDTIVAINDVSISQVSLASALASLAPGAQVKATLARRGVAYTVDVTLGRDPSQLWWLVPRADARPEQVSRRNAWLR
jgi:predicted metalloprotease with PDZ domain